MEDGKKKVAVLVGCNYANTRYELHGCINDVVAMRKVLIERFGFGEDSIELLTDEPGSSVMPSGANIKAALGRMVDKAEPGDVLFFHYSGHGTRIPSVKPHRPFRQDEAIVPCDFNLITGVDFRDLVNRLPKGASFTMLSDSCHSGGLIDKEKEQIGPSSATRAATDAVSSLRALPRSIPFNSVLHHLASLTNITTSDVGTHLLESFGGDASLTFRLPVPRLLDILERPKQDSGILLSGCQADETSADITVGSGGGGGGRACGAFSNAVEMALRRRPGVLSNKEVVVMAREMLKEQGLQQQHPCLYCSDENAQAAFLCRPPN